MVSSDISSLFWTILICTTFALFYSITTTNFIYTYINTITATNSLNFYALTTNTIISSSPPPPPPPPPPSPPVVPSSRPLPLPLPLPPLLPSPPPLLLSLPLPTPPSPPLLTPSPLPSQSLGTPPPPPPLPSQPPTPPPLPSQSPPPTQPPAPSAPPPVLKDDDDDIDLLRLAAKVNPNPTPGVPQKLAFMFLTTSPLPLAPLWELYFHQNQTQLQHPNNNGLFNIYIHADPSFPYNPPFSGLFSNRTIPSSKPTQRGSPSLISAARRLLSHALLDDPSNSRFILISTTCIPLHSFNFTYNILFQTNKSFIEILKNEPKIFNRYISRGGVEQMLPDVPFEDFRVGSQFFVLNRRHARLVVNDEKVWNKFKLPCLRPKFCYPEEHYFSTLLNMKDSVSCIPATLTHVDWSQRLGSHPRMYKEFEIGLELIESIRRHKIRYGNGGADNGTEVDHNYPFLFARKFSPKCLKPLMNIADDVLFKN